MSFFLWSSLPDDELLKLATASRLSKPDVLTAQVARIQSIVAALLASPLRYPGMPADRLWEMEDKQVNLGLIEAEPWDVARLLVDGEVGAVRVTMRGACIGTMADLASAVTTLAVLRLRKWV